MIMNKAVSKTLQYSVYVSMAVIVVGLIVHFLEITDDILWAGVCFLIFSPILGLIVALACLIKEKDTKWLIVALILIAISVVNVVLVKI